MWVCNCAPSLLITLLAVLLNLTEYQLIICQKPKAARMCGLRAGDTAVDQRCAAETCGLQATIWDKGDCRDWSTCGGNGPFRDITEGFAFWGAQVMVMEVTVMGGSRGWKGEGGRQVVMDVCLVSSRQGWKAGRWLWVFPFELSILPVVQVNSLPSAQWKGTILCLLLD
ncbi:hypothetical protein BS47DRAFT_1361738 [Hydnum rufescens UP504]|uniref:Uncharacterized protein n=1 Tax=Hydnum rufescens UP504 TaxID=1448309 RepID=A0A9P6AYI7_9AGAM|nr:hypothetical protein BS47DRAFT_1361738 [Hydnum rufescens UP504]